MRLSDVAGHPVVTTDTAEQVARIGNAIVDPAAHRVVGFKIGGNTVLPLDQIQGIGADAVTVGGRDAIRLPANDPEIRWIDDGLDLTDRPVLTDEGNAMPHLEDIEFDSHSGRLETLVFANRRIDGDRLVGVGRFAVVVEDSD